MAARAIGCKTLSEEKSTETTLGSVFQRKDGRWVAAYWLEGKRKLVYGKTEDEAIQKRLKALENLNPSSLPKLCSEIDRTYDDASSLLNITDNDSSSVTSEANNNGYEKKQSLRYLV